MAEAEKTILSYPLTLIGGADKDLQYIEIAIRVPSQSTNLKDASASAAYVPPAPPPQTGTAYTNPDATVPPTYTDSASGTAWLQKMGMTEVAEHILLPMPNMHAINSVLSYDDGNPGELSKFIDSAKNIGMGLAKDKLREKANEKIAGGINGLKKFVSGSEGSTTPEQLARMEKMFANTRSEIMFSGIGFREFTFAYVLAPKNEEESTMVNNIVKTLRYYSLPELTAGKLYFILPGEFYIKFMMWDTASGTYKQNPNIPKIATCVLTTLSVNYVPTGNIWATLPNGAPMALELRMNFREIERIDRTRVVNPNEELSGY
jgi:hypothetical protein